MISDSTAILGWNLNRLIESLEAENNRLTVENDRLRSAAPGFVDSMIAKPNPWWIRPALIVSFCRIEGRQFETLDRLLNCMAVYSIIAWKIMYLCHLGRECPDLNCEVIFEPSEWKSVYMTLRHEEPPKIPPSLNGMIRMIASLGGYVIRQSTQPGTQTLWFGLQRVHDLSTAWEAFGPD